MKILVISLAGIGDTLFATPLIHELRANFPDATIEVLVMWAGARDALEGNPHLNAVHQKNLLKEGKLEGLRFLWSLRRRGYDYSINTHPQSRMEYRVVARIIHAATRVSHRYHQASALDWLLVNRSLEQDYRRHSIKNNLACLACLGARPLLPRHDYELFLTPAERAWADEFLGAARLAGQDLLGIHVGSGGTKNLPLRRWPREHYLELIRRLGQTHPQVPVLLFGGPDEAQDNAYLIAACGGRAVHPPTRNLRQAAALVARCRAFLSVDTVFMHLAAAMKVPGQIVIETPTWNPPIQPHNQPFILVPNRAVAGRNLEYYRYDGRGIRGSREELTRCMAAVSVDEVAAAVAEALRPKAAAPTPKTT